MATLHAIELLRLKLSKPNNSNLRLLLSQTPLKHHSYTMKYTCRLFLKDQTPQTHLITSDKLRFIIITANTLADLISIY